jgi:hypothetical protein
VRLLGVLGVVITQQLLPIKVAILVDLVVELQIKMHPEILEQEHLGKETMVEQQRDLVALIFLVVEAVQEVLDNLVQVVDMVV